MKREKETAGVTGVIRLIKRWVKLTSWRSGRAVPKSYCVELLVLHAKGREDGMLHALTRETPVMHLTLSTTQAQRINWTCSIAFGSA